MALFNYLKRTRLLLADIDFSIFNEEDLTTYVNMARGQIAGLAECIRVYGTLAVIAANQQYAFSTFNLGNSVATGIQGALNVRQITYALGTGQKMVYTRPFPWFNQFVLADPAPIASGPTTWSQFGQGANGSVFLNLLDAPYTLSLDVVAYPIDLVTDATVEAIPYQWTDAIPWFAAYFAAMTVGDADKSKTFYEEYEKFLQRARMAATPGVLPGSYAQAKDMFAVNRLGLQQRGQN